MRLDPAGALLTGARSQQAVAARAMRMPDDERARADGARALW